MVHGELIVDCFAGGGGTSTGIRLATGASPDIAVDRDPEAVRMHTTNHPGTRHYCADIWQVDPKAACGGHPVGLAWFSPDCTHFSKARGNKPKDKVVRGLAWSVCRWAAIVRPRVIIVENVAGFKDWGPLGRKGRPVQSKKGQTFRKFIAQMEGIGYHTEYRELTAADYGTPTMRRRFFLIARRDGRPIAWPEPTHAPTLSGNAPGQKLQLYTGAFTQIDFSNMGEPILWDENGSRIMQPAAQKTVWRFRCGIKKFIEDNPEPFLIHGTGPDRQGMDAAFIIQQQGQSVGSDIRLPLNTITAGGMGHMYFAIVRLYRLPENGLAAGNARDDGNVEDTGTADDGHAKAAAEGIQDTVIVHSRPYRITKAWLRILEPKELFACQGFPAGYIIDRDQAGKPFRKAEQVRRCGNSVCPPVATALIRANLPEMCVWERV